MCRGHPGVSNRRYRDCAMHCKNIMRSSCATEGVGVSKSQKDSHLFTLYGPSPIPLSMISTFLGGCFYDERPVIAKRSRWRFLGAIVGLHQRETRRRAPEGGPEGGAEGGAEGGCP